MQRYSALMAYEAHLRNSWKPDLGSSCLNNMNVYSVTHCSDSGEAMKQTTSTTKKKKKTNLFFFCNHFQSQKVNCIISGKIKVVETHAGNHHIVKCLLRTFIISRPYLSQSLLFQWFSLPLSWLVDMEEKKKKSDWEVGCYGNLALQLYFSICNYKW